jgi:hypothetical protein
MSKGSDSDLNQAFIEKFEKKMENEKKRENEKIVDDILIDNDFEKDEDEINDLILDKIEKNKEIDLEKFLDRKTKVSQQQLNFQSQNQIFFQNATLYNMSILMGLKIQSKIFNNFLENEKKEELELEKFKKDLKETNEKVNETNQKVTEILEILKKK